MRHETLAPLPASPQLSLGSRFRVGSRSNVVPAQAEIHPRHARFSFERTPLVQFIHIGLHPLALLRKETLYRIIEAVMREPVR